jgi:signal transduction histidine kinase
MAGGEREKTDFAPAARATRADLEESIRLASASAVVTGLLSTSAGLLVVLNAERQIVAVNAAWIEASGGRALDDVLGLRPGESVECVHSDAAPSGCGTGMACRSCGAVIAILASQTKGDVEEGECALAVERGGRRIDLDMFVRASPLFVDAVPFTLLFLQDVTADRQRQMLERVFWHDVNNLVTGLLGTAAVFDRQPVDHWKGAATDIKTLAQRLADEVTIQRALGSDGANVYKPVLTVTSLRELTESVTRTLANHPARAGRQIVVNPVRLDDTFSTDHRLLERCLMNLVLNGLEATPVTGLVRISGDAAADNIEISVWNDGVVPADVEPRIFQRFFSTKAGRGRGHGLFAAKLFCESYLGGQVEFSTSPENGTTFTLRLPRGGSR